MEGQIIKEEQSASLGKDGPRANEMITSKEVRLIGADGENIGVVPVKKAISLAYEAGLDLVEISPNANPPVCKILDIGKYKYELAKKKAEAKKKQKVVEVKEIKLSTSIEDHDFNVKVNKAKAFLEDGDKVKFTLRFKGREIARQDLGLDVMQKCVTALEDVAKVEVPAKLEGKQIAMIMVQK
ncbi:MAG: Translation initiation factor IF-3 [Alphaproteobacteria bacterium ADurb.Bin438]|nr:MAG: Translation initiation factor IF-3 [Alphaproteobacteria bacterium ADurb.Bin438]